MKHNYPKFERGLSRGHYKPPLGRLLATFEQAQVLGCIQAEFDGLEPIFRILMSATEGNPCDGCPVWETDGPECETFRVYNTDWQTRKRDERLKLEAATKPNNSNHAKFDGMNMKKIAVALGVSLNKARQMKRDGQLK